VCVCVCVTLFVKWYVAFECLTALGGNGQLLMFLLSTIFMFFVFCYFCVNIL